MFDPNTQEFHRIEELSEGDDADALWKLAESYFYKGDDESCARWAEKAAELGNVNAACTLGSLYMEGAGVPYDLERAEYWLEKAAVKGEAVAMHLLGNLFYEKAEADKAIRWYREAAKRGYGLSMLWLIDSLRERDADGDRDEADYWDQKRSERVGSYTNDDSKTAADRFRIAAEQGDAASQVQLADLYFTGDGIPKDYLNAFHWYQQAADQGDGMAQMKLGNMYLVGLGVEQDIQKAVAWYKSGRDRNDEAYDIACGNIAWVAQKFMNCKDASLESPEDVRALGIMDQKGHMPTMDEIERKLPPESIIRAAETGKAGAAFFVARRYLESGTSNQDFELAAKWFLHAADRLHDKRAECSLGIMYCLGKGVLQSYATAAEWFERAAEKNHVEAQYKLGVLYANGWGVRQDQRMAAEWFQKAAKHGHAGAYYQLYSKESPLNT